MHIFAKKLQNETEEVFQRFTWRKDIEKALKEIGFKELFGDPDEKIYQNPKKTFDILLYVDWINGIYHIYNRITKEDIN